MNLDLRNISLNRETEESEEGLILQNKQLEKEGATEHVKEIWNMLDERQKRILLKDISSKDGIKLDDTFDYAVAKWEEFLPCDTTIAVHEALEKKILSFYT